MFPLTLQSLAELTGGRLNDHRWNSAVADGATIDSRTASAGQLFFALQGTQQHAVRFAPQAVRQGAVCVITEDTPDARALQDLPVLFVPETVRALTQTAAWCRQQSTAVVIGVTGSVGKTTTRQLTAAVLSSAYTGIQSPANYNNHLGVPLSLLGLHSEAEYAVLELGASAVGEIAELARLAQPELAIITRVAPAHLTGFGSLQGIVQAKGELVEAVPPTGTVLLNADDPLVRGMASRTAARTLLYGESDDADFRIRNLQLHEDGSTCQINGHHFQIPAPGRHMVSCAAAAIATGLTLGLSADSVALGLNRYTVSAGRGRVVLTSPWTVIDDSYNASPASLQAAVELLSARQQCRQRILVLGDMLELGEQAEELHVAAGQLIGRSEIEHVLLLGQHAGAVAEGVLQVRGAAGAGCVSVFQDRDLLLTMLDCLASPGDAILVKGSRGMHMEQIVQQLIAAAPAAVAADPPRRAA